ncbi:MAG: hypothetical protein AAF485_08415, partial [Chloroflexota bacterium]
LHLEEHHNALALYLPIEKVFRQSQDLLRLAHINHNLSMAYRKAKQWQKAKDYYLLSIEHYREIDNLGWLVNSIRSGPRTSPP